MTQKGYYAVIPAAVRYNPKLASNAKLLYGKLTALANEKGYCWAANQYFADLYGVSKRTIISWLKQLEKHQYIRIQLTYKPHSKEVAKRRIYILPVVAENQVPPSEKIFTGYGKKLHHPSEEIFTPPLVKKISRIIIQLLIIH